MDFREKQALHDQIQQRVMQLSKEIGTLTSLAVEIQHTERDQLPDLSYLLSMLDDVIEQVGEVVHNMASEWGEPMTTSGTQPQWAVKLGVDNQYLINRAREVLDKAYKALGRDLGGYSKADLLLDNIPELHTSDEAHELLRWMSEE